MDYFQKMKPVDYFDRIKKMNRMIRSGATGTPSEFAEALGISQSHLFRCLHDLEQYGMEIRYSRSLKTYFYENDKELSIYYSLKLIADSKAREILGGMKLLSRLYQEEFKGYH
jgi:predicted DNA-binding transcriptional regulator YafY